MVVILVGLYGIFVLSGYLMFVARVRRKNSSFHDLELETYAKKYEKGLSEHYEVDKLFLGL